MDDNADNFDWDGYAERQVDEATQAMVETRTDRQILAEMKMSEQPKVTDFTEITSPSWCNPKRPNNMLYELKVKLDSGVVEIGSFTDKNEAEKAELAINQAMIEYRTKREAWENGLAQVEFGKRHERLKV